MIECAGGLLGLPVFLCYGNRIGEGGFWGSFFGRSASWRRLVIPIYFMYGNRMTMGNRNEHQGQTGVSEDAAGCVRGT